MTNKKQSENPEQTRPGFKRFTVHMNVAAIKALKLEAVHRDMYLMDLLHEIVNDWIKRHGKTQKGD